MPNLSTLGYGKNPIRFQQLITTKLTAGLVTLNCGDCKGISPKSPKNSGSNYTNLPTSGENMVESIVVEPSKTVRNPDNMCSTYSPIFNSSLTVL